MDRYAAAPARLPPPWWLHTDLDVLATAELAAVDYPQPGGLTWDQLAGLTATALAADGCAGWSVCIYNPDLDPGRDGADAIVSYITQAITASNQPARLGQAPGKDAPCPNGGVARNGHRAVTARCRARAVSFCHIEDG